MLPSSLRSFGAVLRDASKVKKSLSMRTHICSSCGLVLDRDWNTALTILAAALVICAATNCAAGQAETGSLRAVNASGQGTAA